MNSAYVRLLMNTRLMLPMLTPNSFLTTIQVAEEGRENSPRLTRSAKKRKQQQRLPPTQRNERRDSGMVLNFSPPDQEANRRREQQEMDRKERERYVMMQK